jgi:DNA-directed RNA polymerase subunit RPC12/RpoP
MALIKCEECGREVSDKATACPNCGSPISGAVIKPQGTSISDKIKCPKCGFEGARTAYKSGSSAGLGCLLLFLAIIPGIIYFIWAGGKVKCPSCGNVF